MTYKSEICNNEKKKKIRQMHYPLDKLYYAIVEGKECIICETYINHKSRYIQIITTDNYSFIGKDIIDNFKIKKSLKEEIDSKKINVCLISKDGKEKRELTKEEIVNIIKLTNLLDKKSFDSLDFLCSNMANQISDLLGINANSNPSSLLRFKDIDEIVIPAPKVKKFQELLFNYIKISMILDGNVTITNKDYRIIRALNGCRIKMPEVENEFILTGTLNGEIILECENVIKGFQKPFRNKNHKIA